MTNARTSLWRSTDFTRLLFGQTVSNAGTMLGGLSLTALIYLDATPAQMGLLAALPTIPVLLLGLPIGIWVDRLQRRPLMIASDYLRALLLASIPIAVVFAELRIEHVFVVAAGTASLTLVFDLAYRAYLPSLVGRERLVEGNSMLTASESVAEVAAPSAGGTLVQVATAPFVVALNSVAFLVSALFLSTIKSRELAEAPSTSANAGVLEGLTTVWRQPALRALLLALGTIDFFGGFIRALYALFVIRVLDLPPALMGVTVSAGGAGALIGSVIAGRLVRRLGMGRAVAAGELLAKPFTLLIPLAGVLALESPMVAFAMLVVSQFLGDMLLATSEITSTSLRQSVVSDEVLGRVNAVFRFSVVSLASAGALIGGALGGEIGVRDALFIAVGGQTMGSLWLLTRHLRRTESPSFS